MADSKSRKRKLLRVPRKKGSLSIFNNLTDELLNEILIRLPSCKQAIRCKLVCKRWFSLITSDYFVTTSVHHHRNKDETILPFTLLLHDRENNSVEYVECPKRKRGLSSSHVDLGFLPDKICLEASYGDLILCYDGRNYSICNILTRQWIILPPSRLGISGGIGFLVEPNCVDNVPYKVLKYSFRDEYRIDVEIFSSEQGRWTRFVVTSPRRLNYLKSNTPLIACGRMLYRLPYRSCDHMPANFVMAFDPFTNDPAQIVHIIDLPFETRDERTLLLCGQYDFLVSSTLGVCRGRLRFAQVAEKYGLFLSVWELEDYRMGKWTLVHKSLSRQRLGSVLAFHPNNEDLICSRIGDYRVVVYNLRTGKVESFTYPRILKLPNSPSSDALQVLPITQKWWPTPVRGASYQE
ncbi:uncharacterized protein LOC132048215 [Lycium ferocissimum]|uniref:uncharacterized protein LOC132048215 n=1 Tax=Lycium ferocissimum TaxID=112874 RepID=UPI0028155E40|nr:uncharacterized protein LOC132048215 [Lycium ferocissimum]